MKTRRPAPSGNRPRPNPEDRRGGRPSSAADRLYGRNAVAEALRGPRKPARLLVAEGVREDERVRHLLDDAAARGIPIERPPRDLLDRMTNGANHQGIVLEAAPYRYASLDEILEPQGNVLVLDHIQDPQNFGTLLRAAEAAGVAGVVIPRDRAAGVTPAVVNASAGAVEHLAIARVPNLARALEALKHAGWWIVGLATGPDATDLFTTALPSPVALVVGGEGPGIGANVRRHCDLIVSLPMRGQIASLNAATAGAIALFEVLRREQVDVPTLQ